MGALIFTKAAGDDKGCILYRASGSICQTPFQDNLACGQRRTLFMKSSTKDRVKGRVSEAKGKVKEEVGKAKRDPDMRDRGTAEKVDGKVQRKVGEIKKVFGK